jgi:hypothetical protein
LRDSFIFQNSSTVIFLFALFVTIYLTMFI